MTASWKSIRPSRLRPSRPCEPVQVGRMIVAQGPGRRLGEDRRQQLAPQAEEHLARAGGRRDARRGRRIPVERQLDLDQHRVDVVGRQRIGLVVDRQRARQFAPMQIGEQRRRLGVALGVGPALRRRSSRRRNPRSAPGRRRRRGRRPAASNSPGRAGPRRARETRGCRATAWRSPHRACRSAGSGRRAAAARSSGSRKRRRAWSAARRRGSTRRRRSATRAASAQPASRNSRSIARTRRQRAPSAPKARTSARRNSGP